MACPAGCARCQTCDPNAAPPANAGCIAGTSYALRCTQRCANPLCAACPGDAAQCSACLEGSCLNGGVCWPYLTGAACLYGVKYCNAHGQRVKCLPCHMEPISFEDDGSCEPLFGRPYKPKPPCDKGRYRSFPNGPCLGVRAAAPGRACVPPMWKPLVSTLQTPANQLLTLSVYPYRSATPWLTPPCNPTVYLQCNISGCISCVACTGSKGCSGGRRCTWCNNGFKINTKNGLCIRR